MGCSSPTGHELLLTMNCNSPAVNKERGFLVGVPASTLIDGLRGRRGRKLQKEAASSEIYSGAQYGVSS